MNIISQNCLAGYLYQQLNKEFNNPFVWTVIDFNSMKNLITKWNKINFNNYSLIKNNNWDFSILIDNLVKIQYVHYHFDKNRSNCVIKGHDVFYNKIWEYIIEKYETRLQRMNKNEYPLFILCNGKTLFKDCIYTEEQFKELEKYENVYVFRNMSHNDIVDNAKIIFEQLKDNIL